MNDAVGGLFTVCTVALAVALAPALSLTTSCTVKVPVL